MLRFDDSRALEDRAEIGRIFAAKGRCLVSSNKTNEGQDKTQQRKNGFSRRTFMQGVGVGTGAVGAGVLT